MIIAMGFVVVLVYILAGLTGFVYWFFKRKFLYWKKRGVAYEEPSIPLGNLGEIGKRVNVNDKIQNIYMRHKDESPFVGFYFLTTPFAIITDLDLIKDVLIKDFNSFHDRGLYYNENDDPLSGHLFFLEGQKWRNLRSKLSPTFASGRMKFMFPTIVKVAKKFSEVFAELIGSGAEVEVKELLARFTTDVIGTCAFGIECNSLVDPNTEFRIYGKKIFTAPRGSQLLRFIKNSYKGLAKFLKLKNVHDDVANFFMSVVKQTVEYRESNNIRRNDFMDLLIQLKNTGKLDDNENFIGKMTIEEIAAQAFVFFIAGFETSSTTMGYCLYELALNQGIQDRVRSEIERVLEKHDNTFTYEAMMEMTYLEQVINETLRKYPPVPTLFRCSNVDYTVNKTSKVIEKGTRVIIPVYAVQNDPGIYPNPEVFDPDRFSAENIKDRSSVCFLPFGDGPRNCIGNRFGRMQARAGLVALLKDFRFDVGEKTQIPLDLALFGGLLQCRGGVHLRAQNINQD